MSDNDDNNWERPLNAPPPLFFNQKERDFVKQINDEIIERIIGQTVLYYPISQEHTQYNDLYGEAIVKNFLNPIRVYALVEFEGLETTSNHWGFDKQISITVNFHKRRLTEEQNLFVREGDFIAYDQNYYEIVTLVEPKLLFGQAEQRFEISAKCIQTREGLFDAR